MGKRRPQTAEKQRDQTENSIPHTQTHHTHKNTLTHLSVYMPTRTSHVDLNATKDLTTPCADIHTKLKQLRAIIISPGCTH